MWALKALFLLSIASRRIFSDSVNQSGRFFFSFAATSVADFTICSSKSSKSSDGDRKSAFSGCRFAKYSLVFFWKIDRPSLRSILLSIFWTAGRGVGLVSELTSLLSDFFPFF